MTQAPTTEAAGNYKLYVIETYKKYFQGRGFSLISVSMCNIFLPVKHAKMFGMIVSCKKTNANCLARSVMRQVRVVKNR